jgi:undecaprenyl diphosphate synthase
MSDLACYGSREDGTRGLGELHVGLIPDGARRWAAKNGTTLPDAYDLTFSKLAATIGALLDRNVPAMSLYLLSRANLQRSAHELNPVYNALERFLYKYLHEATATSFDLRVAGSMDLMPVGCRNAVQFAMEQGHNGGSRVYLCIAYSPQDELNVALRTPLPNDANQLLERLWVPEPLDVVIRTSGVPLLSDFLPLQAGYARLYFLAELFNDVEVSQILDVLEKDSAQIRKFGT